VALESATVCTGPEMALLEIAAYTHNLLLRRAAKPKGQLSLIYISSYFLRNIHTQNRLPFYTPKNLSARSLAVLTVNRIQNETRVEFSITLILPHVFSPDLDPFDTSEKHVRAQLSEHGRKFLSIV
jgi:hypothetical protein